MTKTINMQRPLQHSTLLLGLALVILAIAGCRNAATLRTEYVEGVVTVDGEPVPEATVQFVPVTEGEGISAVGFTDQRGVYKLTAQVSGDETAAVEGGTVPGEYYVGVTKTIVEAPLTEEEAQELGVEYEQLDEYAQQPQTTYVVPRRYNNPRESGLRVTVSEGQNNIPLELSGD